MVHWSTHKQTNSLTGLRIHRNNTNSVISTAQHRHLILTYYVLRQTHTTNSFVIAHYANRPHNPPNITHVVQVEKTGSDNQNESRKTFHTKTAPGATCSHQIQLIVRWLNPVSPPFDAGSGEVAVETLEMVSPFLPSCQPRSSPNLRSPRLVCDPDCTDDDDNRKSRLSSSCNVIILECTFPTLSKMKKCVKF